MGVEKPRSDVMTEPPSKPSGECYAGSIGTSTGCVSAFSGPGVGAKVHPSRLEHSGLIGPVAAKDQFEDRTPGESHEDGW
jgi:hypothetical protein